MLLCRISMHNNNIVMGYKRPCRIGAGDTRQQHERYREQ